MKNLLIALCSLLMTTVSYAQDSSLTKAISLYKEKILPYFRPTLLQGKEQLHAVAGQRDAPKDYNLQMANLCAGLLQYDSALYYVGREMAHKDVTKDIMFQSLFFLLTSEPDIFKRFTDSVYFGRYNADKLSGRTRFIPSELCTVYIRRQLLIGPYTRFRGRMGGSNDEEKRSIYEAGKLILENIEAQLKTCNLFFRNARLPQYSKDGTVVTAAIVSFLTSIEEDGLKLAAARMADLETLLEKNDIGEAWRLCWLIDKRLLGQGHSQHYGTQTTTSNGRIVRQTPHDGLKEMEKRRKQAGLESLQEQIRREEKSEEEVKNLSDYHK